MSGEVAIRVEGLGKQYRIGGPQGRYRYRTLRESLVDAARAPFRRAAAVLRGQPVAPSDGTIWALKDVSFEVNGGEVVGIIGRNGAGKTTLLKVLSRITEPTEGYAEIHGRVGSLLEVGTGFHPELTGRENIYLNGAILGMKKAEIERRFDEIVAFAEIEQFIDTPVKHYSSGMYVRLAFAVAAHLEPEILLVDEVLAVGDAAFQKKCLGKMGEVAKEGRTVLFVSHNMAAVTALCGRGILVESGKIAESGSVQDVVAAYAGAIGGGFNGSLVDLTRRSGSGDVRLTTARFLDSQGLPLTALQSGQSFTLEISYEAEATLVMPRFLVGIKDSMGRNVAFLDSGVSGAIPRQLQPRGQVMCHIDRLPLTPGMYWVNLAVWSTGRMGDHVMRAVELTVIDGDFYGTGRLERFGGEMCLMMYCWSTSADCEGINPVK